jgi:vacuolar-type H+-ATPase subunit H
MASLHTRPFGATAPSSGIAAAIERVLAAERAAVADVAECRAGCTARVADARLQARRRLERAERIAQAIHARTDAVATARAARAVSDVRRRRDAEADIAELVARLAAELTGPGDD